MIRVHDLDCGDAYARVRVELLALVRQAGPSGQAATVAPTPAWTVLDVVAHLVGLAADLNRGRFPGPGDDPDRWTEAQVAARRGRTIDELATEWDQEGPAFEDGLRLFGYETGCHFVGDLLQHRADIGLALGQPGLPDRPALDIGVDWYLEVAHQALTAAGSGGVELVVDGHPTPLGPPPVLARVVVTSFEAFRLLGARRSLAQISRLPWEGDPAPVLAPLLAYPAPTTDLHEPEAEAEADADPG